MGTIGKGILGGFSGTVGTVIGGNWKGIEYMRSRPTVSRGKSSIAQEVQKQKFGVATKFVRAMKVLHELTLKATAGTTKANTALAHTLKNAVTGVYPNLEIDYSQVMISRGDLPNASEPEVAASGTDLEFKWVSNAGVAYAQANDRTILVAYDPQANFTYFTIGNAVRSAGAAVLNLPGLQGRTVETWLAFVSDNGKMLSEGIYLGRAVLS